MSAESPVRKEKRSRKSTDVNNSFVKNITSRVSDLLPSAIREWFSSSSSSNTNSSATVAESDSSTEDEAPETSFQPPAKRMRYGFEWQCRSPSQSNNYIPPEMKCTSTITEPNYTFSAVQSQVGQSTFKPETHFVSTSLLSPKEETTISEHKNSATVRFSSHSIIKKRKSLFGEPVDEQLPRSNSFRDSQPYFKPELLDSPFYSGKTRYEGAASSNNTFSDVQSQVGQSTFKPEKHFVSTSLLSPKEETTISEHKNSAPVQNLHTPFSRHSIIKKRKSLFGEPVEKKLPRSISFRDSQPYFKPALLGSPFYSGKTRYGGAASSNNTFSAVQSRVGQSTSKPETHFVSTSLLSPKEETTISEHKNSAPVQNLHTPFSRHSIMKKRKSLFGEPVDEKLPRSISFRDSQPYFKPALLGSPFYSGKTRYGGAASSYINQPNIKHRKGMLVKNSENNESTIVSHGTRHLMDLLENYSSPLIEAKRISQLSTSNIYSLDNTVENNAYKAKELYVPKIASILNFKQKAKLIRTTSAARQIIASNSSSPAFKPYPNSKNNSNSLKPTSDILTTKIRSRLTRSDRNEQKLNDSNKTVELPTEILQSEEYDLPKFTLEMSVTETSTASETLFTSTPMTVEAKSNKATDVFTSASDKTKPTPTTVIMKNDSVAMNINEVNGEQQTNVNDNSYKFSKPDLVLDETVQIPSSLPNYIYDSLERQISAENGNEKEKNIDKEEKEEKEEKESGKLISIVSENKTGMQSAKWKCENCWVPNNSESETCICCGSKRLGISNIENEQCTECKIALKQQHNDKCIECEEKYHKSDKLPSKLTDPISMKWKCEDCLVENDLDVKKCVCCGNNNLLSWVGNSKSDEWKCEDCWIKNKNNCDKCVACGGPKPVSKETINKDVVPPSNTASTVTNPDTIFKKIMKSQSDRWECSHCLVCNDNNKSKCVCCDAERPGTNKEAENFFFNFGSGQNTTFKFGIDPNENIPPKDSEHSSDMQLEITVPESETNNNIVPKPLNFSFGIPTPKSGNNIIIEEESIAEDTPPPEQTFKFGTSTSLKTTMCTTANVFNNAALSATKYTDCELMSNSKEIDEKVQEVPNIEEPHSSASVNAPKPGELFGLPVNNSSAESSMPAFITFGTVGQSSYKQAEQAITSTVENTKASQSTFSFTASNIKPAVNLFSETAMTTSTSYIPFSTAPKITTPTISFFQKNEVNPPQTFFQQNTLTSSTLSLITVMAPSHSQVSSFGSNIQNEEPKYYFTFENKSEVPSLFASPMSNTDNTMSNTDNTMSSNVLPENNTISGTLMSGGNGLATGNFSIGGNGIPLNSLSPRLLAAPAMNEGMWPINNVETNLNNLSSIQSGSFFDTQPKQVNTWSTNQNASNDSLGTINMSSGNNLEPITDLLGLTTDGLFGAVETKDTMWPPNNNSDNIFGTNPSTNNLQKSTSFNFGSSTMQFNGDHVTSPTFGSSVQPPQNIFGMSNQNNNNPTLFSNPIQHQTPPTIFGAPQINNSTPVGIFGAPGPGAIGNPRFGTPNQPISTFEAPQLNPVPTQTFNFGAQQTTGVFGFGQQQPQSQSGVYNFGAQPVGTVQRQFNIGTTSGPNMVGRRVIRKAVRRTTQR